MGDKASVNTHELHFLDRRGASTCKNFFQQEFCDIKTFEYNVKRKFSGSEL